jgi:hypothetical protein
MVTGLPRVTVSAEAAAALTEGASVPHPITAQDGTCAVFTDEGQLLAIGQLSEGRLRPRKVLQPATK